METLELMSENITGEYFVQLIHDCFDNSDVFSMTRYGGHAKPQPPKNPKKRDERFWAEFPEHCKLQDEILSAFDEFRIGTIESAHWFYIWTVPYLYVDLYRATEKARDTLLAIYDNIYLYPPYRGLQRQRGEHPADLCFFQNGVCWMGSCSHEGVCYLRPMEQIFASALLWYADWRKDINGNGDGWLDLTTGFFAEFQKCSPDPLSGFYRLP